MKILDISVDFYAHKFRIGKYDFMKKHKSDIEAVVLKAQDYGVHKMFLRSDTIMNSIYC